jgi:purine-binding chemotaxis protein CheW
MTTISITRSNAPISLVDDIQRDGIPDVRHSHAESLDRGVDARQYLCLAVGGEMYALGIDTVREIQEITRMTALPLTPKFVKGVMNLRGAVVPVIDLSARFGGHVSTLSKRSAIVIVESGHSHADGALVVGVLVDGVSEVLEIAMQDIEPVPVLGTRIERRFLAGISKARGGMLAVLDIERILDRDEMAELMSSSEPGRAHLEAVRVSELSGSLVSSAV